VDSRPVARRRCQRRDDATVLRTIAAAENVRTRSLRGTLGNGPDDIRDDGPDDGNPDDTPDDVPTPGRTDTSRAPDVATRTAANSRPASGRFCTADKIGDSTCGNSIPATWSQAGPGSRGGS